MQPSWHAYKLDEARALLKEMGKTAASSGRAMKKAKAAPKPKSK